MAILHGFNGEIVEKQKFSQYKKREFYRIKNKKREISSIAHKHCMSCKTRKDGVELDGVFYSNKELNKALKLAKKGRLYRRW